MAKIDKSQYTKEEWRQIRNQRRIQKIIDKNKVLLESSNRKNKKIGFVLGNGVSRAPINPEELYHFWKNIRM